MLNVVKKTFQLPDGREISIETGKLAKQADGSVVVSMGNVMLLATVVSNQDAKDDVDFLPLSVDYQEKFASAGRIPGSIQRREGRLSDNEILISRLVDRAIRPLFPSDYHADTQINISLLSADAETPSDALAALAASSAIAVSDIPMETHISEVRVARVNGEFVINPTRSQIKEADIDMIVAASATEPLMVEGEMKEVSEQDMVDAIRFAHEAIKVQCQVQEELAKELGIVKREYDHEAKDEELKERMHKELYDDLYKIAASANANKSSRGENFSKVKEDFVAKLEEELGEDGEINSFLLKQYFGKVKKKACRDATLKEKKRLDGRQYDEIRDIWCEVDYLPSTHGSAVFTRGETQSLTTATLGTKNNELMQDSAVSTDFTDFILHYNFPAFSTGEVRPNRGPGRREVGHGNLALRALKNMIPEGEDNPYTIRLVSDILESNGSSSMATVCAGTLALMDAGVQIKAPVAGIAMGLISDAETGDFAVLSDILGDEDHLGDMDFKVTGTEKGITACQMDIKIDGLKYEILTQALEQAKAGRLHILGKMLETLPEAREDYKPHTPRSILMKIPQDKIGAVIGPGGKVIQEIQKVTGASVNIEEKDDAGFVSIFAVGQKSMEDAKKWVEGITAEPEVGKVYDGIVKNIMNFGAFIEFMPGKEGLLHISEIKWERIPSMDGILETGEEIKVKLVEVDRKTGKFRLSRKVLLPKPEKKK